MFFKSPTQGISFSLTGAELGAMVSEPGASIDLRRSLAVYVGVELFLAAFLAISIRYLLVISRAAAPLYTKLSGCVPGVLVAGYMVYGITVLAGGEFRVDARGVTFYFFRLLKRTRPLETVRSLTVTQWESGRVQYRFVFIDGSSLGIRSALRGAREVARSIASRRPIHARR